MKFYFIDVLGNLDDEELCFINNLPKNMGLSFYMPAKGERMDDEYPNPAFVHMSLEEKGLKLASLLGNTHNYLKLHQSVVDVIQQSCADIEIEYLPFQLINHKGRVHSDEYFIVNPIGTFDAMNLNKSQIKYFRGNKDKIVSIKRYVLDPEKLAQAPALFRLPQKPTYYIIREDLAQAFNEHGFTNIVLREIEQG